MRPGGWITFILLPFYVAAHSKDGAVRRGLAGQRRRCGGAQGALELLQRGENGPGAGGGGAAQRGDQSQSFIYVSHKFISHCLLVLVAADTMRAVILAICLSAASAFMGAPVAHRAAGKSSMSMVTKSPAEVGNQGGMDQLGITSPIGYWDPWGFNTSPEKFYRYRQVELKHGRIAQAAMLGLLVQENFRFPGAIDLEGTQFADIPNGLAALPAVPGFGWVQIVFLVGVLEAGPFRQTPDKPIGDFGVKYFGVKYPDGDIKADKLNKEINNGRLAMMGFLGAIVEDKITGSFLPVGIPGVDFTPGA